MLGAGACLLSRVCECLHSGLDGVDWEHECMLQDPCDCSGKHVLQGTPYIISRHTQFIFDRRQVYLTHMHKQSRF